MLANDTVYSWSTVQCDTYQSAQHCAVCPTRTVLFHSGKEAGGASPWMCISCHSTPVLDCPAPVYCLYKWVKKYTFTVSLIQCLLAVTSEVSNTSTLLWYHKPKLSTFIEAETLQVKLLKLPSIQILSTKKCTTEGPFFSILTNIKATCVVR